MTENKLADLSMDFAADILKLCDGIKGHYSIINQLERSATSINRANANPRALLWSKNFVIKYALKTFVKSNKKEGLLTEKDLKRLL